METFLLRNEKLVRENERLKIAIQHLIAEKNNLTENLQRTTANQTPEDTTLPVASSSVTKMPIQLQSTVNEEQFRAELKPQRASSPHNLQTLIESSSYVETKDTGFDSQESLEEKALKERLLGEVAYQLDRRILSYIFKSNERFYGYTLTNIPIKINEVSTHPLTGKVDEDYRLLLNQRYETIKETLSSLGYKMTLHPQFSEFIINSFGILQMKPKAGSSQANNFLDPKFVRGVIETTAPSKLQKDLVLLLDCLCELAVQDEKPIFLW